MGEEVVVEGIFFVGIEESGFVAGFKSDAVVDAGVVDEAIDATVFFRHIGDGVFALGSVGEFCDEVIGLETGILEFGDSCFVVGLVFADDDGSGSLSGEASGDGLTNAQGTSGYDNDFVFKV